MIANNPSGTTHTRDIPGQKDFGLDAMKTLKYSMPDLFESEHKANRNPCIAHNGQHVWVRDGEKFKVKDPFTKRFVAQYQTKLGPKKKIHFIVACKCGKRMDDYELINSSEVVG